MWICPVSSLLWRRWRTQRMCRLRRSPSVRRSPLAVGSPWVVAGIREKAPLAVQRATCILGTRTNICWVGHSVQSPDSASTEPTGRGAEPKLVPGYSGAALRVKRHTTAHDGTTHQASQAASSQRPAAAGRAGERARTFDFDFDFDFEFPT